MPSLLQVNYSSYLYWKIQLEVSINLATIGISSIYLKKNQLPDYGDCSVDPLGGLAFDSYFYISCNDWVDLDGYISRFEYYGKYNFLIYSFVIIFFE